MIERNKAIRTLIFFCAGAFSSLATVACEQGQMYCMVTANPFVMTLKKTSGGECLPPVAVMHAEHYLGLDKGDKSSVPSDPSVSVVLDDVHSAFADAKQRIADLEAYAKDCPTADPKVNVNPDKAFLKAKYWGLSDFKEARPDADGRCIAKDFKEAALVTPAMDAIPACKDEAKKVDIKAKPALPLRQFKYKIKEIKVTATPYIIGTRIDGKLEYEGPGPNGQGCKASYTFNSFTPKIECESTKDCTDTKKKGSKASQINEAFRDRGLQCFKPAGAKKGICAFKKAK